MNGIIYTLVLSLILSLTPVSSNVATQPALPQAVDVQAELNALEDKNWMELSNEQMLEDYDYLYNTLKENFPFFGVAKRKAGADIDQSYTLIREQMKKAQNDLDFWFTLCSFVNSAQGIGHLSIFDADGYSNMQSLYGNLVGNDPVFDYLKPWIETLDNPVSSKNYELMRETLKPVLDKVYDYQQKMMEYYGYGDEEYPPNVTTDIIEEGKIAYLNINSMNSMSQEEDKKVIFDFYEQVKDYDNLIIDITNNGGGSTRYYEELIVEPNITETKTVNNYALIMDGENNRRFFDFDAFIEGGEAKSISELPHMEKINAEDLKDFDYFMSASGSIYPSGSEKMFDGKIWLLVSGRVYSASEAFANFCKETGFATIVGTRTGGDGIGTDPVLITMPNSGIVVRYSALYGVTSDGANSEEFGTEPDIWQGENQTALEACLEAIAEGKH